MCTKRAELLTFELVGNLAGGLTKTVGGVLGTAGRGLGQTINNTTGTKVVGDGLQSVTNGVEDGGHRIGRAAEDAGQWKK